MFEASRLRSAGIATLALGLFGAGNAEAQEVPQENLSFAEVGALTGRSLAQRYGFCPLDVIGTEQNGVVIEDPEIPILRANRVSERNIRLYIMGRGHGCRQEFERSRAHAERREPTASPEVE